MEPTDITIQAYASYSLVIELKDSTGALIDLSAISMSNFIGQIREAHNRTLLAEFTPSLYTDGTDGRLRLALTPAETEALPLGTTLKYDAFWTVAPSTRHRLLYGDVTVEANISKA